MDINELGKVPPHNNEAEQAVLGAMLLDNEVIPTVTEVVKNEDFYRENHKEIFDAIMDLYHKGENIDIITVPERLKQRGTLEAVGGYEYISQLADLVPTTANVKYYSKIVEENSLLRKLIKASSEIMNMGYEASDEVSIILEKAEKSLFEVLQRKSSKGFVSVKELLIDIFNKLEELYNTKGNITGIPTKFIDLDYKLSGLHNSDLILIAARPAMGKTAFALNIAHNVAVYSKVPVAIFSLEMSSQQLMSRILCSEAMVDNQKLKTGKLDEEDWKKLAMSLKQISEAPLYIDDTPGLSITEIRAKCRKMKLEKNIGLVVIDYLQLMQGHGRGESRQQEISEISRGLKILAKEIDVPVITLSQLSRAPEARTDHRPMLSDLRESGAIEQDADIVIFLYRDDYYNPETEKKGIAEVIVAKHRNGSTGTVELKWLGQYTKFVNGEGRNFH